MLEAIVKPKRVEKRPWIMLIIGFIYASLSLILVKIFFARDTILSEYAGMIVVTFCVMFSLPFMYSIIKREEIEDEEEPDESLMSVIRIHKDAIYAFMWLFLGFIIAFSLFNIVLNDSNLFNAQIETYCIINSGGNIEDCVFENSLKNDLQTGASVHGVARFLSILENNIYVMMFTLLFSLIFGAGAIFILAWNASVIAAAIGIFSRYEIQGIPCGILRYMIHGGPEIAAYFITALAGGIFGTGAIRNGFNNKKFYRVVQSTIILLFISIVLLILSGLMEVYFTPKIMNILTKLKIC
ncbi:MAG: stage II sporulation protein M [Nanoarchaeota archaeon]